MRLFLIILLCLMTLPAQGSRSEDGYFTFPAKGQLTGEMVAYYQENGFVVLTDYLSLSDCDRLLQYGSSLAHALNPSAADLKEQFENRPVYLARSATSQIPFFYPEAYRDGQLTVAPADAAYVMGNNSAVCDDVLRALTLTSLNQTVCQSLGYKEPQVNQSQLNLKSAVYSQPFLAHQDQMFSPTLNFPLCTFMIPFSATTPQNGCLKVIPGSHKNGSRMGFLRQPDNSFAYLNPQGEIIPPDMVTEIRKEWQAQLSRDLAVPAGSLILLHGNTIHGNTAAEKGFPGNYRVNYSFSLTEQGDQNPRCWNYNPDYPLIKNAE